MNGSLQVKDVFPQSYNLQVPYLLSQLHRVVNVPTVGLYSDAGTAAITYLILLILLSRQMERSRTPSGISRVSRWSFLAQSTVDSVSFAGHITFAILAEGRPSLSLIAPAFLACILFIYEAVRPPSFLYKPRIYLSIYCIFSSNSPC